MRLSFDWLSDYVDLDGVSIQELAEKLTMGAFEVEEVRKVGPDIQGPLIVGEIVEINPHPNADKIRLTKVKVSANDAPLEIVCGASNIVVGQRIPVALPGARVINRHDGTAFEIKETKIRGVHSSGMLCSPPEIGLNLPESEGILVLNGGAELGADVKKLLHLYPDHVLHVEPRSNRGDALCVFGMAREVAALLKRPLKHVDWRLPEESFAQEFEVRVENADDCPYFTIRLLADLKVGPSPARIARRLEAIGVRTVNNIVDVTNYVLHELGQPLHGYDLTKLNGDKLEARRAKKGEKLTTIDDKERELTDEVLVIADKDRVVGVAGVMGGKESEISDVSKNIALEAACFNHARVRRSSRLLGLSSDSSLRFERGVDLCSVARASDRAAHLILEACGGKLGKLKYAGQDMVKPMTVDLRLSQVKRLSDIEITPEATIELLEPLGFAGKTKGQGVVEVLVPSFRQRDVYREIDLIEEVCRLWGYDRIEPAMPRTTMAPSPPDTLPLLARQTLIASGLNETWTSSLVGKALEEGDKKAVSVLNPLSPEHKVMRQSLVPGLVDAVAYNHNHGQHEAWVFEIGRVYERQSNSDDKNTGTYEEMRLAGAISGSNILSQWQENTQLGDGKSNYAGKRESVVDFYSAKGAVENLLSKLAVDTTKIKYVANTKNSALMRSQFHPGRSCVIEHEGEEIGCLGEIHPALIEEKSLRSPAYLFELSLDKLRRIGVPTKFSEIYTTPYVVRDLTVDADKTTPQAKLYDLIVKAGEHLIKVELVSQFELDAQKRSLSYRLTFQHPTETLRAETVDATLKMMRQCLSENAGATFRQ
ncbi:MAG: phenylalanine--tRNA ligase subunit beta [Candidatus Obscuribacterales bacterium]|nr:phenylalanine--tRNA ligase subunit beta [Candidatus Obscuribacterales bacterium]